MILILGLIVPAILMRRHTTILFLTTQNCKTVCVLLVKSLIKLERLYFPNDFIMIKINQL
ncbi:hypothetical protein QTP88_007593 [Uroleucon formosanum]